MTWQNIALLAAAFLFGWWLWDRLKGRFPSLANLIRAKAAKAEALAKPLVTEAEKDVNVISDAFQAKLTQLGGVISGLKTRAETAEAAVASAPKQADLDQANQHIADLMTQLTDAQAKVAAAEQDKADELAAVAALADQAGA